MTQVATHHATRPAAANGSGSGGISRLDLRTYKLAVYDALREQCRAGGAAVVVSFDLDELLENCDRIVVMNGGELLSPEADETRDRAAIGRLMVGAR